MTDNKCQFCARSSCLLSGDQQQANKCHRKDQCNAGTMIQVCVCVAQFAEGFLQNTHKLALVTLEFSKFCMINSYFPSLIKTSSTFPVLVPLITGHYHYRYVSKRFRYYVKCDPRTVSFFVSVWSPRAQKPATGSNSTDRFITSDISRVEHGYTALTQNSSHLQHRQLPNVPEIMLLCHRTVIW